MTAVEPQVRHDPRCRDWQGLALDAPECTCRDAAGYRPVDVSVPNDACPLCGRPADWAIGDDRACTEQLGAVAAFRLATGDGFAPLVIEALAVAR